MKLISISVLMAGSALMFGCQSTAPMSEDEKMVTSKLCSVGDMSGVSANQDMFEKAVMDCGGYDIFTEDMLVGSTLTFSFNNGKSTRIMKAAEDGTASYDKPEKGTSETIQWKLDDRGNLSLMFEDGYLWHWVLQAEAGNYWAVKSYGIGVKAEDRDIMSMVVTVTPPVEI